MPEPIFDFHTLFGPVPPRASEPGTARLQTLLTQHGVSGAVALSTRGAYHNAHAGNRETLALCQQVENDALIPAAVLDPRLPQPHQSIAGAKVLCILPAMQKWPLDFSPLCDVLETLMQMGGAATASIPIWWEAARLGDATQIASTIRDTKYPAPVVLGGVTGDTLIEALSVARGSNQLFVATNGLRGVGEIEMATAALGASRVVYASSAPARSMGAALGLVEQAGLSAADADLVLGGNARRLLRGGAA